MNQEVLETAQMYRADELALHHVDCSYTLMVNAAEAVAARIKPHLGSDHGLLVLCGKGNNGGDGFLTATKLHNSGYSVDVLFCGNRDELQQLSADAGRAYEAWQSVAEKTDCLAEIQVSGVSDYLHDQIAKRATGVCIVDAIFGAGLKRDIKEPIASLIEVVNRIKSEQTSHLLDVLSIDLPSGVNGDTGEVCGVAFQAAATVSFFRKKPAHLLQPGKDLCGDLTLADIGIPASVMRQINPQTRENSPELWLDELVLPTAQSHKYLHGHTLVISGPRHKTGAARLAAMAALRAGAGVVSIAGPSDALDINAAHCTEIMLQQTDTALDLEQQLQDKRISSMVIGPGHGIGAGCREMALIAIAGCACVVLDADALTSFCPEHGGTPGQLFTAIHDNECTVVLTPHEGEFRKLFTNLDESAEDRKTDIEQTEAWCKKTVNPQAISKLELTRRAARISGATIVYKGASTVIAANTGECIISTNGEPWLATAGSGDVLAGTIAGRLARQAFAPTQAFAPAQAFSPTQAFAPTRANPQTEAHTRQQSHQDHDDWQQDKSTNNDTLMATAAAVWLHGEASKALGPGLIASDLPSAYPRLLNDLLIMKTKLQKN